MAKWKKQSHVVYQCSYHIVWCPKYRFRILKGQVGKYIENRIRGLCEWKKVEILELNVLEDHVHMVVVIPPRLSVSDLMGTLKGKTAISLFKNMPDLKKSRIGETISGVAGTA
jgi:putative transposase